MQRVSLIFAKSPSREVAAAPRVAPPRFCAESKDIIWWITPIIIFQEVK